MKYIIYILIVAFGGAEVLKAQRVPESQIEIWDYKQLESRVLLSTNDTTYLINCWATWCKPCVEELPFFVELDSVVRAKHKKVKVILLSFDFRKDLSTKLKGFVQQRAINTQVVLFSDPDMSGSIDKISNQWSGALPATLVFNAAEKSRSFYEQSFSKQEVYTVFHSLIGD